MGVVLLSYIGYRLMKQEIASGGEGRGYGCDNGNHILFKGNLDYEIPVYAEDEIGYLSASLNYMSSHLKDMEDYQKKLNR